MKRVGVSFIFIGFLTLILGCHSSSSRNVVAENGICTRSKDGCLVSESELTSFELSAYDEVFRKSRTFSVEEFHKQFNLLFPDDPNAVVSLAWPNKSRSTPSSPVVLFIEPYQQPISSLGRFREQVLGKYIYDINIRKFVPDSRIRNLPKRMENMNQLWAKFNPPLEELEGFDISKYYDPKLAKPFENYTVDYHGSFVFDLFAVRSPGSNFLFAEFPNIEDLIRCDAGDTVSYAFDQFLNRLEDLKAAYSEVLHDKEVSHVVITHTYSKATIRNVVSRSCPILKRKLDDIALGFIKYSRSVFQSSDIRVFHSISNDPDKLLNKEDWQLFCPQGDNVFRISYLTTSRTDISRSGTPMREMKPPEDQKLNWSSGCTQVVINSGFDEEIEYGQGSNNQVTDPDVLYETLPKFSPYRPAMAAPRIGAFLENSRHKYIMANSWATPLAAAMAIHIEENFKKVHGRRPTLVELKRLLYGRVFDPILHKQFEVYYENEGGI